MDKREKIIQASIDVFKEQGIEKTKISNIVKQAGIAQGTFYLYFPSKLAVMPAIAEKMIEQWVEAIDERVKLNAPLLEQVNQLIEAAFQVSKEFRDLTVLTYAGLSTSDQLDQWENIYASLYQKVEEIIDQNQSNGSIRQNTDSYRLAKLTVGTMEMTAEQVFLYDEYQEQEERDQKEALSKFLYQALKK
ncbi:TetR family transcriptional regulator [Alkalibacillus silvisoli]|uniref:TetR family transcriptional regulator n=1 Tax=Alkalibacillus silvisoli TaxID=392823 RepID=A0ABN0ZPA4_9BACI